ncbi:MAG: sulfite exporter TauE/SafE family protein [Alphaproteobacteria bacterium]|nr:sulfite exporter TauE/SafE family protein [Alphaproteobacteria bacterium]MCB9930335.1 sulfite exporter TauE/SafE family protein [Alphaproteobacteria bacterium]
MLEGVSLPIGPEWIAVCGAAAFAGGFIRGFVGFGGAVMLILAVSAVIGPREAVAIAALSGLPPMLQLLPAAIRTAERGFAVPFGLASFLGAPLGTLTLVSVAPGVMKIGIAVFVLAMVLLLRSGRSIPLGDSRARIIAAGIGAGWIQGVAGVAGPPTVALVLGRGGEPAQQRANVIGAVTAMNFCSLGPLWWYGLFTREVIVLALLFVPLYSVGTWLGQRYFTEKGQRLYRQAALAALTGIGLLTLAKALADYWPG